MGCRLLADYRPHCVVGLASEPGLRHAFFDAHGLAGPLRRYHVEPTAPWAPDQEVLAGFVAGELVELPGVDVVVVGAERAASLERAAKQPGERT
jgi:hypothetical protein